MRDYISREAARDLMNHNQAALTEHDLDSIPAADVVPVDGYHRSASSTVLAKTPKKTLINWLRTAESNEAAMSAALHDMYWKTAYMEPIRFAEWEWFDAPDGQSCDRKRGWRCSDCKTVLPGDYDNPDSRPSLKYCSECGAAMDGGGPHAC